MPILVPVNPSFANDAEKVVWKQLKKSLPDDVYLFHGVRVTEGQVDCEADLVVIWPDKGIAFVEVKGGYVSPNEDGTFTQGSGRKKKRIDPVTQIHGAMYEIRDWLSTKTSLNLHVPQTFLVAFPQGQLQSNYSNPRISRAQFIDKDDLSNAREIVQQAIESKTGYTVSPDTTDCDRIAGALKASTIDATDVAELAKIIDQRTEQIESYINENEKLLDFVCEIRRFHVKGTAGTGKTALALAHSRRLKKQNFRVAFLCYSRALATYIRHSTESLPREERIDVVKTFHGLAHEWGLQIPPTADDAFWDTQSIEQFIDIARTSPEEEKFDAIVVDEAQDFGASWWNVIEELLRNHSQAGIYAFGDIGQEIFQRREGHELPYTPLRLHVNLRNAEPIARLSHEISHEETPTVGIPGPNVFYAQLPEETTEHDTIIAGDAAVEYLLEDYRSRHIALLTTKSRHPQHRTLAETDNDAYLRRLWDESDIFYGTVEGFKGLERNCIVLVVNGFHHDVNIKQLMYTGVTRARDLLVVVSKRSFMEQAFDQSVIDSLHRIEIETE